MVIPTLVLLSAVTLGSELRTSPSAAGMAAAIPELESSVAGNLLTVAPAESLPAPHAPDAQIGRDESPPAAPRTGMHALLSGLAEDFKHLSSTENVLVAALGGGVALGVHPLDQTFNARLRGHDDAVGSFFAAGKYYGGTPEQVGMTIATYAFGRLTDRPKVAHLGMDLLRAQIVDETLTEALKFSVGRQRPDGSNRQSFPSGHTSVTFATAAVIERRLGWRYGVIAYAVASYVAASRLHENVHYLSDVVFGAAVGTIAGRTIDHSDHRSAWTIAPAAVPGGVAIMAARVR